MSQNQRIGSLICVIGLLAVVAVLRLQLSYDLAFFLPPANTEAQQILLERVGQGPGAQLTFVVLPNQSAEAAEAEAEATNLAIAMRKLPQVQRVLPEQLTLSIEQLPPLLWNNRLLLDDLPTNKIQWLEALSTTLDDMMFASDPAERAVLAGDPTLASISALQQFTRLANNQQFSSTDQQVLLVQASAAAFDLDSQTQLVDDLRNLLKQNNLTSARLYGSGVYGVDLQRAVKQEATLYSLLASVALLVLLFFNLRSFNLLLVTGLPLLAGGIAGLTVLALVFTEVHGITLAFGFTLLGVAVDYPLHLVVHQQQLGQASTSVWPTLRLGVLSTAIAYLAFALSGTQGLQQLGLFALVGVCVAALASAWLCPTPGTSTIMDVDVDSHKLAAVSAVEPEQPVQLRHWPWLIVLLMTAPLLATLPLFSDDLGSLTPVPAATLAADAKLRENLGVTNMRYLVALRGVDQEQLLRQTETVVSLLYTAVQDNQLEAYQSITSLLPSQQTQRVRRMAATSDDSIQGFDAALAELPFAADAFASFRAALTRQQATKGTLNWHALQDEPVLRSAANNLMYPSENGWVSLVLLAGIQQPQLLREQFNALGIGQWIDLKAASLSLAADYRSRVLQLLALALVCIALLLLTLTRQPQRVIWLLGSLSATVACAMLGSLLLQGLLSLFDLMALTLVAGLGLDYGLFYSQPNGGFSQPDQSQNQQSATARAVLLCALSSLLVFGILACSSIPLLRGIGTTVACGVIAAYLLARAGRYAKVPS